MGVGHESGRCTRESKTPAISNCGSGRFGLSLTEQAEKIRSRIESEVG